MKVEKSTIYIGSTLICNNFKRRDPRKDYYSGKDTFAGAPDRNKVLLLRIENYYVPVDEITGPHDLNKLRRAYKEGYDRRFLSCSPYRLGQKYIDMNNPPVKYFAEEGEVSLKALWRIQKELLSEENKETEI